LAATNQNVPPEPVNALSEDAQLIDVPGNSIVLVVRVVTERIVANSFIDELRTSHMDDKSASRTLQIRSRSNEKPVVPVASFSYTRIGVAYFDRPHPDMNVGVLVMMKERALRLGGVPAFAAPSSAPRTPKSRSF
jgi:hypothetical protein